MIYLAGEVNTDMFLDISRRLDKRPRSINICMNSEGGDLLSAFAIYDRLMAVENCTITASGECSSSGLLILQAAKIRRATPTTQFYIHLCNVEYDKEPNEEKKKEHNAEKVRLDQIIFGIYGKKIKYDNMREALSRKNFDVKTALRLGFIDEVYEGKK